MCNVATGLVVPSDMSVRERAAFVAQIGGNGTSEQAATLAGYIQRTAGPWAGVATDAAPARLVPVRADLLEAVVQALMGLDAHLADGLSDALHSGNGRVQSEREACARDWETFHGADKYRVAAWLRTGEHPQFQGPDWLALPRDKPAPSWQGVAAPGQ